MTRAAHPTLFQFAELPSDLPPAESARMLYAKADRAPAGSEERAEMLRRAAEATRLADAKQHRRDLARTRRERFRTNCQERIR